jgi:lipase
VVTSIDIEVAVPGGRLHAVRRGVADAPPVLLIHGLTASQVSLRGVADALPDLNTIAVDLRGRGASAQLPGPYGMARHADDLVALMDSEHLDQVVVTGHSMGAFVALVLAHRHPGRVSWLVLVDGGPVVPMPEGADPEVVMQAVVGASLTRLGMTFSTREAYLDFWRAHPAFAGRWNPLIEAYVDHDLVGEPPDLRSRVNAEAVRGDNIDILTGHDLADANEQLAHPTVLLLASRGMQDDPAPLYPQPVVDGWLATSPTASARRLDDLNHYMIVFDPRGIAEITTEIRAAVRQSTR